MSSAFSERGSVDLTEAPESIVDPTYVREDARGRFVEVLADGTWKVVIHGRMRTGAVLGNHYHRRTRVFFYLIAGKADVQTVQVSDGAGRRFHLNVGQGTYLEPGWAHAIRFREHSEFILLKSRRYDPANDDTYPYMIDTPET